jgi:predicted permease
MSEFFRRLHYLLNRRRLDRELAADMEVHREMAAREGGIQLGNSLHLREESRDAWGWTWIDRLIQDLRYAIRAMRKSPGFTLMAILLLAVGTGVNIAAFGFFDFMVLRPLNVREPATLVRFHRRSPQAYSFVLPYPEAAFFRDYTRTLSAVLMLNYTSVAVDGEPQKLKVHFVSENWFTELGAPVGLGRLLDAGRDGAVDAQLVVVLGNGFWQRHFGGDPSVVGRIIRLNDKPATVIGVAAPEFTGLSLDQPDVWAPIHQQPYFATGSRILTDFTDGSGDVEMWGRLRPQVSPFAAQEELQSLAAELRRRHPAEIWENEAIPGEPAGYARGLLIGGRRGSSPERPDNFLPVAAMLSALALLILAVACGNLGSLLMARGVARDREIAIRAAVGAGSGRLIRQLLTESLVLALFGSAAGLMVGWGILRMLMLATGSPAWLDPTPDWRVIAFAFGAACAAALLFGLAPALQIARRRHRATAIRQVLLGAQVAASCVLVIVSALLIRAINHAVTGEPGFDYRSVVAIDPGLSEHGFTPRPARTYLDTLQDRLRAIPGAESIALTGTPPFGNRTETVSIEIDGRTQEAAMSHVSPEFFRTLKIPLLHGRALAPGETHAMVISQSLAHRFWPAEDPVGKQLPFENQPCTIVGIAGDARMVSLENPDLAQIYFPIAPKDLPGMIVIVRSNAPERLAAAATAIGKAVDPQVQLAVDLLNQALPRKLQTPQQAALAMSVLGLAALALACLGITGMVGFAVSQYTKEIGIRMALGATPRHVLSVVLRRFSTPVAIGLLLGVGTAAGLSNVLRGILYGISGVDPIAYFTAIAIFLVAVAVAGWLPARRALRIDPMRALRCD